MTPIWYEVLPPLAKATHSCNGKHLSDDGFLVAASFDEKKHILEMYLIAVAVAKVTQLPFEIICIGKNWSCLTFGGNEATFLAEFNENWHWRDSNQYLDSPESNKSATRLPVTHNFPLTSEIFMREDLKKSYKTFFCILCIDQSMRSSAYYS